MKAARTALAMLRSALSTAVAACDLIEQALGEDADDELIELAKGWGNFKGSTLITWARDGRLRAFEVERHKLAAWKRDIIVAIESVPAAKAKRPTLHAVEDETDPFADALASGELRGKR